MRKCFLEPIPELAFAADLLNDASDALILGDLKQASLLIARADIPAIMEYAKRIVGKMTPEVHRMTTRPVVIPKSERDPTRMPPESLQYEIFSRDGWRCRFCETKVISKKARQILVKLFPFETHWNMPEYQRHAALYAMAASLDHLVPHSRGGKNEYGNFVTSCTCCQHGRGEWTLEESELIDPRSRNPMEYDGWDGLSKLNSFKDA